MAVPLFRASALLNDNSTTQTSTISGTIPASAQVGDIALLAATQATGVNTMTGPAGWTQIAGPAVINSNITAYLWAKKLVAGDPGATVTVTATGGARFVGLMSVFSGADTVAELTVATATTDAAATSLASPTAVTPEADCAAAFFWVTRAASTTAPVVSPPGTQTKDAEVNTSFTASPNHGITASHRTTGVPASGTTIGGTAATVDQPSTAVTFLAVLTPGAAAPGADPGIRIRVVKQDGTVTTVKVYAVLPDGSLKQVSG